MGSARSKGTKVFALTGKITNTGLVEVPMGITLREIVEDIGGGVPDGRRLKGAQTGGPGGGIVPASMLDLPVEIDESASEARYENGVLELTLPKKASAASRKITIQ